MPSPLQLQMITPEELGAAVRRRRKALGTTLDSLSLATGISKKTLIKFEKGGDVRFSTLAKILGMLGLALNFTPQTFLRLGDEECTTLAGDDLEDWG